MDTGRIAEGAELSTAAVGACDEPTGAVGNSGRTQDSILRGLLQRRQRRQVFLDRCEPVQFAVRATRVVQLDDQAPTIPNYEKFFIHGIRCAEVGSM